MTRRIEFATDFSLQDVIIEWECEFERGLLPRIRYGAVESWRRHFDIDETFLSG